MKRKNILETIFDHNVTDQELRWLLGNFSWTKEEFINLHLDEENNNALLYRLYMMREDKEKAKVYLDRIPDTIDKWFSLANHDH